MGHRTVGVHAEDDHVLVTHDVDEAILLSDRVYVMTARPGRMKMVQSVDLTRPRSMDVFSTPAFMALKSALLTSIREEANPGEGMHP